MARRPERQVSPGAEVRRLLRRARSAALATSLGRRARPFASLVTVAWDLDASPILMLSDMAEHSRNLAADGRASLLVEDASHLSNPQTGPRASLVGRLRRTRLERCGRRFLAAHPAARTYASFADFRFYRMAVERVYFVGGFGRAGWLRRAEVILARPQWAGVAACEQRLVEHMNADHADAVAHYAKVLLGAPGKAWRLAAIDPEGADLRSRGRALRLDFEAPVRDARSCRERLVALARTAPPGAPGRRR
jgi:putative heme iron utilization protein